MVSLNDKAENTIALLKGVHDVMVKLLLLIKERGVDTKREPSGPSSSTSVVATNVIDLSDEWTASIDKPKMDMIVRDIKNSRTALYVSHLMWFLSLLFMIGPPFTRVCLCVCVLSCSARPG
jgi:hypothetical protein